MNRRSFFAMIFAAPAAALAALRLKATPPPMEMPVEISPKDISIDWSHVKLNAFVREEIPRGEDALGVKQSDVYGSDLVIHLRVEGAEEAAEKIRAISDSIEKHNALCRERRWLAR